MKFAAIRMLSSTNIWLAEDTLLGISTFNKAVLGVPRDEHTDP